MIQIQYFKKRMNKPFFLTDTNSVFPREQKKDYQNRT